MSQLLSELRDHAASELYARPAATSPCPASRPAPLTELATADSLLPAELVHGIEAVITPTSPQVRSAAISSIAEEIYRTVEWLHGGEVGQAELASFAEVLAAVRAHEARMGSLDARA